MSKIQEALKKLQSSTPGLDTGSAKSDSDPVPLARVTRSGARDSAAETATVLEDDRLVEIDYGALRSAGLLAPVDQQRHLADQYRIIKRPLLVNASARGDYQADDVNLIMIASPLPGDGKTFNCLNLALSMATERDRSVLLVDADVAKPHISSIFGLEDEPGLIDLLLDEDLEVGKTLLKTNVSGLRIMPAGRRHEHATELLASRRMASIAATLSKTFPDRVVIFDSPPLLATSEARVLASLMGQIVLVVCSARTPQDAVMEAVESLDQDKAVSVVFNQSGSGFGTDQYGAYGSYGSH